MKYWTSICLLFFSMTLLPVVVLGQEALPGKDSTNFYRNIESLSEKRKITKFFYRAIFKPVKKSTTKKSRKPYKKLIQKPYSAFEGKIIRQINIESLDPFGYSITDTIISKQNFLSRSGNKLHIKSHRLTIRNLMIIKENQVFDSLLVKESERLVRSQSYVRDVMFFVVQTSNNSDSVDIFIRELDKWSLVPKFSYSSSIARFQLNDKNFLGLGHEYKNSYSWFYNSGEDALTAKYTISNFRNTYISTSFQYSVDEFGNFARGVELSRPLFSPFTRWSGGLNILKINRRDSIDYNDTLTLANGIESLSHDYWAGHSIQIFNGNSEDARTTNFIYTVRFAKIHFQKRPSENLDPFNIYTNQHIYMGSIGLSTRKYVRDKYIFKFGVTEDVPIGKVISVTGGYREQLNSGQLYIGSRVSVGNYYTWGYFGTNLEYGTFFSSSKSRQGVIIGELNYFTGLFQVGKWKIRQFIKPAITIGIHRSPVDSLVINDGFGLNGFNSSGLTGTNRILVSFQTQFYAPWDILGFRFGPYLNYSFGMLGDAGSGFSRSKVYSQIGVGVLIKNENLIIETFQFSISFYPMIPGVGNSIFKVNSIKSTDFGFRDFTVGKPGIVNFE
jgi:hypothetical protein